jgi:outer membrane protein
MRRQEAIATKRHKRHKSIFLCFLCLFVANFPLFAQSPDRAIDLDLLSRGKPTFPTIWNAYRPIPLPPIDPKNRGVSSHIQQGKLILSLNEFLQLVVENNLTLEAARYNYMIAQVDLLRANSGQAARGVPSAPLPAALFAGAIGAGVGNIVNVSNNGTGGTAISGSTRQVFGGPRGIADPTLSINTSWDRVVDPLNSTRVTGVSTVAIQSAVLQTRFQQQLPVGSSYSVSFNMQRQLTTQGRILYNPAFTSFFSVDFYLPLMNGSGRANTRRFVSVAENNRKSLYQAFHGDIGNTLVAAADTYLDFLAARERERLAERALALARTIHQSTEQRIEVGSLPQSDLITAQAQVATAQRDLIVAQTNTQLLEVRVKSLITKSIDEDTASVRFEPTDELAVVKETPLPPLDDLLRRVPGNPGVRRAEFALENDRIAENYTRSALRPNLSVFGQVNSESLAPGASSMFRTMLRYAYPEYAVVVQLSFSIKNRAAQADNLRARLERQRQEVVVEQTKSNVALTIRTAVAGVTQSRSQIEAAQRAVATSQATADAEQERWTLGYSNLDNVYQKQVDLMRAQLTEIQLRVNYAKTVISEESAVGLLLENHGIDYDDAYRGSLWKGAAVK